MSEETGKSVSEKPPKPRGKAYRGELLPPSVRKTTVDLVKELTKQRIAHMVVGAVPVQFYGRERFSRDVDIVLFLNERNSQFLLKILNSGRYEVRYPLPHEHKLEKPEDLLDWHLLRLKDLRYDGLLDVHLKPQTLGLDETSYSRAKAVKLSGQKIVIPSVEDYLITKFISRRPSTHDFEDITSTLVNQYNTIDWEYLEDRAKKFGVSFLLDYYKETIQRKLERKKVEK